MGTIAWLKTKGKNMKEQIALATLFAKDIATEIYPEIEKWMRKTGLGVTIIKMNPFNPDTSKAVEAVQAAGGTSQLTTRLLEECDVFMTRRGELDFGGNVTIVVGIAKQ
jgi:hypothetical protein